MPTEIYSDRLWHVYDAIPGPSRCGFRALYAKAHHATSERKGKDCQACAESSARQSLWAIDRPSDGTYWVKWYGKLRPKHPWQARELKDGKWTRDNDRFPPWDDVWLWGAKIEPPTSITTLADAAAVIGQSPAWLDHDGDDQPEIDITLLDDHSITSCGRTPDGRDWIGIGHLPGGIGPAVVCWLPVTMSAEA